MRSLVKWNPETTKEQKSVIRETTRKLGYLLGMNDTDEPGIMLSYEGDRHDELTSLVGDRGLVYFIEAPEETSEDVATT